MSSLLAAMTPAPAVPQAPALSVLGQLWALPEESSESYRLGAALAQATGLPTVTACVLAARGYHEGGLATAFLSPRLESLPNPSTLAVTGKNRGRFGSRTRCCTLNAATDSTTKASSDAHNSRTLSENASVRPRRRAWDQRGNATITPAPECSVTTSSSK